MAPDKPAEHRLRVGVFGLIMPELDEMFGIDVYAAYGMTETVTHAITGKPIEQLPDRSMGHVTPGYEIAVVDKETGELCAEGVTGELWLRGTRGIQLFLEYFDNDEANEKAFDDGWFKTGDMVDARRGRQRLLPGARQGHAQGRRRERVGQGGRGADRHGRRASARSPSSGKQHDFLDQVPVAFVIKAPGATRRRRARSDGHRRRARSSSPTSRSRGPCTSSTSSRPARSTSS